MTFSTIGHQELLRLSATQKHHQRPLEKFIFSHLLDLVEACSSLDFVVVHLDPITCNLLLILFFLAISNKLSHFDSMFLAHNIVYAYDAIKRHVLALEAYILVF